MTSSFQGKRFLVFGGSGSIGGAITRALLKQDATVHVATTNDKKAHILLSDLEDRFGPCLDICGADVESCYSLYRMWAERYSTRNQADDLHLNGIIYAVGNCPTGGFDEEVRQPLATVCHGDPDVGAKLREALLLHAVGLRNVSTLFSILEKRSPVVVISSAITRLTAPGAPPIPGWLHAGHYAAAIAAKDMIIAWLRRDPVVVKMGLLIHRLALAAVDTPFHQGCEHAPPAMLSLDEVAGHALEALASDEVVDKVVLPEVALP